MTFECSLGHSDCQCSAPVLSRVHTVQDINPLPFPVLLANSMGWVAYAYVVNDVFVLVPNEIGFVLRYVTNRLAEYLSQTRSAGMSISPCMTPADDQD